MRHVVAIQQRNDSPSEPEPSYDGPPFIPNWRCAIQEVTGGEVWRGRQVTATATHVLEGWFVDGVTPTMRVEFIPSIGGRSRYFNIVNVKRDYGAPEQLTLDCIEVQHNGQRN